MGRLKVEKIKVFCGWCKKKKLVFPCKFKNQLKFYCNLSHQLQFQNKFDNPAKKPHVKIKIGKSSKIRGAIWIARKSKNYYIAIHRRGKFHPNWKNVVGYTAIHYWLYNTYGKASECEKCKTSNREQYHWALLKGKKYEKNRSNFWQLCSSCHSKYDGIIKNIKKMKKYV